MLKDIKKIRKEDLPQNLKLVQQQMLDMSKETEHELFSKFETLKVELFEELEKK